MQEELEKSIDKLQKRKNLLANRIEEFIAKQCKQFEKDTGVPVSGVTVNFTPLHFVEQPQPTYVVSGVTVDADPYKVSRWADG